RLTPSGNSSFLPPARRDTRESGKKLLTRYLLRRFLLAGTQLPSEDYHGPHPHAARLDAGGILPGGVGPRQDRPAGRWASRVPPRTPALVARAVRAGRLRLVRGLRHLRGP